MQVESRLGRSWSSLPVRKYAVLLCAMLGATGLSGCGGCSSRNADPGSAIVEAERTIELKGVGYLHSAPNEILDGATGGLYAPGDLNGDGEVDFVVAASRQGGGSAVDHGWIEAYSGRDGALLWQVGGKGDKQAQAEGDEQGYRLADVYVVEDLDQDRIPDLYCREAGSRASVFLLSGRDGRRLKRFEIDRPSARQRPLFCRDMNGDGIKDLAFIARKDETVGVKVISTTDFSTVDERFDLWPQTDADSTEYGGDRPTWLVPEFADVNGDGIPDCLLRRGLKQSNTDPVYTFAFAILSGKDFSVIRTFETDRPRVGGDSHYAAAGDLDRDGSVDILMTSSTGGGPDNRASLLRAISGADGAILWQVLGTALKGGQEGFAIEVETGKKSALQPDVEFEAPVAPTPDLDGDGVSDVATLAAAPGRQGSRNAVLLFSGADGGPLGSLQLSDESLDMAEPFIVFDSAEGPAVAAFAQAGRDGSVLARFALSDLQ